MVVDTAAYLGGESAVNIQYNKEFDTPIKTTIIECFSNKKARIDVGLMFEKINLNDIDNDSLFLLGFSNALSFQYFMEVFKEKIGETPDKTNKNLILIIDSMIKIQAANDKWIKRDNKDIKMKFSNS